MQRLPTEHAFLLLTHAIESYHRRTWPVLEATATKHRRRVRRIVWAVRSTRDRKLVAKALRFFGVEPSLETRLRQVYASMPDEAQKLLGDKDRFCVKVAQTRNYFTHFDKRLKQKALAGGELWRTVYKLKYLIRVLLLRELGLAEVDRLG
jgi:HEPN superfamily Apea-like protein